MEKYESFHAQRPEENFNLLEAEDSDGKMMLVTIDAGFKDWPLRPAFPWLFQVDINYKNDDSGLPTSEQMKEMQGIEDQIVSLLTTGSTIYYIGHRTYDNVRNVFFYASEYKNNSKILHRFVETVPVNYTLLFFVRKDKYWQSMEIYFNVMPED